MFRELARKKQELPKEECIRILQTETRGILSVHGENGYPYGMPMNHWFDPEDGAVYFHCGRSGHRLDALQKDARVSYCVCDRGVREEGEWAWHVSSVILFGEITVIDDQKLVREITAKLSRKFTQDEAYIRQEIESYAAGTLLLRLDPVHMCGKLVKEA